MDDGQTTPRGINNGQTCASSSSQWDFRHVAPSIALIHPAQERASCIILPVQTRPSTQGWLPRSLAPKLTLGVVSTLAFLLVINCAREIDFGRSLFSPVARQSCQLRVSVSHFRWNEPVWYPGNFIGWDGELSGHGSSVIEVQLHSIAHCVDIRRTIVTRYIVTNSHWRPCLETSFGLPLYLWF